MQKKYRVLVVILLLVIAALLGIILWQYFAQSSAGTLTEDPNAVNIREPDAQKGGTGNIAVPGFEKMTIRAGTTSQDIWIYNPEKNNCYFVVSIILPDGKTVYKSGFIAPGKAIYKAEFTQQIRPAFMKTQFCNTIFTRLTVPQRAVQKHILLWR